jgi:hypothetical protein
MEISHFAENIGKSLVNPKSKKSVESGNLKKIKNERITKFVNKKINIPRVFFEPLFMQDPDKLKKYILGGKKNDIFYTIQQMTPGAMLQTWENNMNMI